MKTNTLARALVLVIGLTIVSIAATEASYASQSTQLKTKTESRSDQKESLSKVRDVIGRK